MNDRKKQEHDRQRHMALAMDSLDRIGQALKEKGISFEDMLAAIEETRQEIYDERNAGKAGENA